LGIRPEMPVAEAVAMEPCLVIHEEDPQADRQALEGMAEWLVRFSPCVGLEEEAWPESLLADITGCAAVFKGEDRLLQRAVRELRAEGWEVRVAIAGTVGAAWGLAHYSSSPVAYAPDSPERAEKILAPLPVAALRLSKEARQLLSELGVECVGQLLALPRAEIPARFGAGVLQRLDQALGRAPEVITPCRTIPEIQASRRFEYATDRFDVLKRALEELTEEIHAVLRNRHWGARQVECRLQHEKAAPCELDVTLFRPTDSLRHLTALLRARLEQVRVAEPVTEIRLRVTAAEPLYLSQAEFLEAERAQGLQELSMLLDRLSNRLGREAVTRPALVPDPQPEYACRFQPLIQMKTPSGLRRGGEVVRRSDSGMALLPPSHHFTISPPRLVHRPVRLWPTPAPIEVMRIVPDGPPGKFRWAGTDYRVARAWGPERIATGWWRGDDVHRDYYMVATDTGARFWLFLRQDDNRWFLHGCFD
jgi:protein ImuB